MTAEEIAIALDGRQSGNGSMAKCPAHDDRTPSLSITEGDNGRPLLFCFAGCSQEAVIAALRELGLWGDERDWRNQFLNRRQPTSKSVPAKGRDERNVAWAMDLWNSATSASGTPVESYLRSRDLNIEIPTAIRFRRALKHPSGGLWPTMIALVTDGVTGKPRAIHRTYINRDGTGKAPVEPQKMMLGPCRGRVVRLSPATETVMIGEGIETVVAAMCATGLPGWAALSAAGLRSLDLPDSIRDVIVLADGDDPGEAAAKNCAIRWSREGRRVRIARPPRGQDFNDLLQNKAITGKNR